MKMFSNYALALSAVYALTLSQQLAAQSVEDIQAYCQSMTGGGLSEEDQQAFMNDCIAEQRSYLEQDLKTESYDELSYESSDANAYQESNDEQNYEQEYVQEDYEQDQKCYARVDEHIQKLLDIDPNTNFDYDQLLDQCLNGKL